MAPTLSRVDVAIRRLDVHTCTIPTDFPEADGTYAWDVIGSNDYRQVGFRFHGVNEPTEPQWSFSFFKNTRLTGRVNMQVRIETFNVFNVRIYGGPNTDPNNATFGVVSTASHTAMCRTIVSVKANPASSQILTM